jgi:hypothetical protein
MSDDNKALRAEIDAIQVRHQKLLGFMERILETQDAINETLKGLIDRLDKLEADRQWIAYAVLGPDGQFFAATYVHKSEWSETLSKDPKLHKLGEPMSEDMAAQLAENIENWSNRYAGRA